MHLAKGLEFRAVLVVACDEGVLPLAARVADVADAFELDEVIATERQLLYVAATRARDRLVDPGIAPERSSSKTSFPPDEAEAMGVVVV